MPFRSRAYCSDCYWMRATALEVLRKGFAPLLAACSQDLRRSSVCTRLLPAFGQSRRTNAARNTCVIGKQYRWRDAWTHPSRLVIDQSLVYLTRSPRGRSRIRTVEGSHQDSKAVVAAPPHAEYTRVIANVSCCDHPFVLRGNHASKSNHPLIESKASRSSSIRNWSSSQCRRTSPHARRYGLMRLKAQRYV